MDSRASGSLMGFGAWRCGRRPEVGGRKSEAGRRVAMTVEGRLRFERNYEPAKSSGWAHQTRIWLIAGECSVLRILGPGAGVDRLVRAKCHLNGRMTGEVETVRPCGWGRSGAGADLERGST